VQIDKINKVKASRNNEAVDACLKNLDEAARNGSNVMPFILAAVEEYATLGEICDVMREVFGEYTGM
jgi:methylmalonyl-CoA mutase N-terminal domain/subunit